MVIYQTISISLQLVQNVYFCNQYKLNLIIMSDIATRVKKIIVDKLGVDEAEVTLLALILRSTQVDKAPTVMIDHYIQIAITMIARYNLWMQYQLVHPLWL